MASLNVFQRSLEKQKQAFLAGELEARKELLFEVLYRIVIRSPVDSGKFRACWNVGLERNNTSTLAPPDPTGQSAITEALAVLSRMKSTNTRVFITNGLVYGNRLEHGWSDQAPAGMVGITLAEFPELARRAYGRIGGKGGLKNV
jgi:hypothetical protein